MTGGKTTEMTAIRREETAEGEKGIKRPRDGMTEFSRSFLAGPSSFFYG